jgi:hypothetical protein
MRAGGLDRRYVAPRGSERFADAQVVARTVAEFYIRYSQDVAGVDPTCRLIYPAIEGVTEPPERSVFDILEVVEVGGRRRELRITAQNRADRPEP